MRAIFGVEDVEVVDEDGSPTGQKVLYSSLTPRDLIILMLPSGMACVESAMDRSERRDTRSTIQY